MNRRSDTPISARPLTEGVGASDATNGGGAGAGVPDADTGMSAEEIIKAGNVDQDKARLFPTDQTESSRPGEAANPKPASSHM